MSDNNTETRLTDSFIFSMTKLVNIFERKDLYLKEHSSRVCGIAMNIVKFSEETYPGINELEIAGKLHDIGNIGVRKSILHKLERLTDDEISHIREHPLIAQEILKPIEPLRSVIKIIVAHHERFDGMGYPLRLKGEEIPVGARILAIADSFDAMISARPYRPPMSHESAALEIKKNLGTQFDPVWGKVFLDHFYSVSKE